MSNPKLMSVTEAQEWVAYDKSTRSTPRAARTIVAQAEQIKRLQTAVGEAVSTSGDGVDDLIAEGTILPGDMEAPA